MYDVTALGKLLVDFAARSTDEAGWPTMAANPGGISSVQPKAAVRAPVEQKSVL